MEQILINKVNYTLDDIPFLNDELLGIDLLIKDIEKNKIRDFNDPTVKRNFIYGEEIIPIYEKYLNLHKSSFNLEDLINIRNKMFSNIKELILKKNNIIKVKQNHLNALLMQITQSMVGVNEEIKEEFKKQKLDVLDKINELELEKFTNPVGVVLIGRDGLAKVGANKIKIVKYSHANSLRSLVSFDTTNLNDLDQYSLAITLSGLGLTSIVYTDLYNMIFAPNEISHEQARAIIKAMERFPNNGIVLTIDEISYDDINMNALKELLSSRVVDKESKFTR